MAGQSIVIENRGGAGGNIGMGAGRAGYVWIGAGPDALLKAMAGEIAQSQDVIRFSGIRAE